MLKLVVSSFSLFLEIEDLAVSKMKFASLRLMDSSLTQHNWILINGYMSINITVAFS